MSFSSLLHVLLLPPTVNIVLVLAALWCGRRQRRWWARGLMALALLGLWLPATPLIAGWLSAGLQPAPLVLADKASWQGAQAIVVLGGGRQAAPEWGAGLEAPNYWTASRLRHGAWLYRQTGLPLAVSGGLGYAARVGQASEAALMAASLQRDYVVNVRWQEDRSRNTWENAMFSHELLAPAGVQKILLVTQALHMRRAQWAFAHAGFTVIAAPTDFYTPEASGLQRLLPSPRAWLCSLQALHEYGGLLRYRLRAALE